MAYKIKQYGPGFKVFGTFKGWHFALWEDSCPKSFVFLKRLNEKDFIICDVNPMKEKQVNLYCGILKLFWFSCIDGWITEITEEEAQNLLDTKMNKYSFLPSVKEGDEIYVKIQFEIIKCKVLEIKAKEDGLVLVCDAPYGFNFNEPMESYGKTWSFDKNILEENVEEV